jgi:hypothetical protein
MSLDELYDYLLEVTGYMYETEFIGEIKSINDLNIKQIQYLCDKLIEDGNSVAEYNSTLTNMLFCDRKNVISKRLALTLFNRLHLLSKNTPNFFASLLVNAYDDMYYMETSFDVTIFNIFYKLLIGEIKEEKHTKNVLNELTNICKNLKFIYHNNELYTKPIHQPQHEIDYYQRGLLDKNIRSCIDILSNFTNSDLHDEKTYAKAICVKLYLRSLLIGLNNLEELSDYDKIMNEKQVNNSLTKKMMRDVFIQNYFDLKDFYEPEGGMKHGI